MEELFPKQSSLCIVLICVGILVIFRPIQSWFIAQDEKDGDNKEHDNDQDRKPMRDDDEDEEEVTKIFIMTQLDIGVVCNVKLSETKIREVKAHIEEVVRIPIENQRLLYDGKWLKDDDRVLSYYNIQNESVLDVVVLLGMEIFVKISTGVTITLEVNPANTIRDVKRKIQEKEGTSPDEQRLVFEGQHLRDGLNLLYYRIKDKSTVHLLSRLTSRK